MTKDNPHFAIFISAALKPTLLSRSIKAAILLSASACLTLLPALRVHAAGTMQWSVEVIWEEGTGYEKDYYDSTVYPNMPQAIAGMQALQVSILGESASVLTHEAPIYSMSPYSIGYRYTPGNPPATVLPWTYGWNGAVNQYSDQSSAVAGIIAECESLYAASGGGSCTAVPSTVTQPDGSTVNYSYDGAHRLTDVTDGLGNHIHYTLDPMGNRTAESTYDPAGTLATTRSSVYNSLSELYQTIGSAGTAAVTTTYGYDNNGNQTSIAAPLSRNTSNQYDALNRLIQMTDPENGVSKIAYDANDQVTSVTDPMGWVTSYTRDGFGEVRQQASPDTGTTVITYDSAGNVATKADARGGACQWA